MYYVYILKCADKNLYTGCTENIKERLSRHNSGYVSSTSKRLPIELIAFIIFKDKHKAFDFKKYLKLESGRTFINKYFI